MVDQSREDWLRPRLEALGRRPRLVPDEAHAVDFVPRACPLAEIESLAQREVAAAAARTSIANEIRSRWPGAPYIIRQGRAEDYEDLGLEPARDALVVFGVVYRFDS
ncbi:hypothetical protein [Allosalinactinospora lopnorensis]|uniref:hypothetical protein n=1 Tax=Allosalinactinospora lopnorensis TaxID=1352348 RepID=UPI000623CD94|nr:hypothetical protein [Allosalinactinospora lopnorensis]